MTKNQIKTIAYKIIKSKYIITFLIFYIWLLFFDKHNIIERGKNENIIDNLKKEKLHYREKINNDNKRIHELKTNKKTLEKFAREQYLMKKSNEDIFIVIKE